MAVELCPSVLIHINHFTLSVKSKRAAAVKPKPPPSHPSEAPAVEANPDEPARRYPRRELPPTDYAALNGPDEDHFICKL